MRAGLAPAERIRRRADFQRVYDRGARIRGRLMTLFVLANGLRIPRLGVAATRKLGGAVQRNLAKRMIREAFRLNKPASGLDVVVVPRQELLRAPFSALEADYVSTLGRRSRAGAGRA